VPSRNCALAGLSLGVDRADELARVRERRIVRVHLGHGQDRGDRLLEGQTIAELLLDDVADHSFGLCAEDVEGVSRRVVVGCGLQGQQTDLWPVAVRDHQLMLQGDRC